VVTVANEDGALLPGMTANVRFAVNQKDSVLRAPNAALRYKPSDTDSAATKQSSKPVLYRLEDGKPVPVNVKTGIADGAFTEITEGGIKEGDKLVVREATNKDKSGSNFKLRMF
jgi:HlyD family secretion protein